MMKILTIITLMSIVQSIVAKRLSPRELLESQLNNGDFEEELAKLNVRNSHIIVSYRDMCDHNSMYCIDSEMKTKTVKEKVALLLDSLSICVELRDNSSSVENLCHQKCFYGADYTQHCRFVGGTTPSNDHYDALFNLTASLIDFLFQQLDLFSGNPRNSFHLGDIFSSSSDSYWFTRMEYMFKFFVPYIPLMLILLATQATAPIWRIVSSLVSMLGVVVLSSISDRGYLPIIYAFGMCAFLSTDHSNPYVKSELWNGFALTIFNGLVTTFCPNWFIRGSIQVALGVFSCYSLLSISKRIHQYTNNLGIFFIRCLTLTIMADMTMHLVMQLGFIDRNCNGIELFLMVFMGYSKNDGTLIHSLVLYFEDLEMVMEKAMGIGLYSMLMDYLPFGIVMIQNVAVYSCLMFFFIFRTVFGILPIFLTVGFESLNVSSIIHGFVFGHATVFRTFGFVVSLLRGFEMNKNFLLYNYAQLILLAISFWSSQDMFMLNVLLSLIVMAFTGEKSHFRNLDIMFSLKFNSAVGSFRLKKQLEAAHDYKLKRLCGFADDYVLDDPEGILCAIRPSDQKVYMLDGGGNAFPVHGSGPWMSLHDLNVASFAAVTIQFGDTDPDTGNVVIRQVGSGSFAFIDDEYMFLTIEHNVIDMSHLDIHGSTGTFRMPIVASSCISFVPKQEVDVIDNAIGIRMTKKQVEDFQKACPTCVATPFKIFNGDMSELNAAVVISCNGTNAVNHLECLVVVDGFIQLTVNLMSGDSGTIIYGVDGDGVMYVLAAVSHGYNSLFQPSCAAFIAHCDRVNGLGIVETRNAALQREMSEAIEVIALQYRLTMDDTPVSDSSVEAVALSSIPEETVEPNLPLGPAHPFLIPLALTAAVNNLQWPSTIGTDSVGEAVERNSRGNSNPYNDFVEDDGRIGGLPRGKKRGNWKKDKAQEKRGGFMSYHRLPVNDPVVAACASIFDLSKYESAEVERMWNAYIKKHRLKGFPRPHRQGDIIVFNRKRGLRTANG